MLSEISHRIVIYQRRNPKKSYHKQYSETIVKPTRKAHT